MQRWVNLGENLLAVPRPATANVSQMAHPAIQILPPAKRKVNRADALVSIFVWDHGSGRFCSQGSVRQPHNPARPPQML